MKLISWNVNGIRAIVKKGFLDFFNNTDFDVLCLQEIKVHDGDIPADIKQIGALQGYKSYWHGAEKKGYSGVAVFSKAEVLSVSTGVGSPHDHEGRALTIEFEDFYLINVYVPNAKRELLRLDERLEYNKHFIEHCEKLRKEKPIIFCGDLNVAHKEIDLKNPKSNVKNPGFSPQERAAFDEQLAHGYHDTFRMFHPEGDRYTWWSYMFHARDKNIGWRIDYFIVSDELKGRVKDADILDQVMGSDHCPVTLEID